jgi:hypothetical protein
MATSGRKAVVTAARWKSKEAVAVAVVAMTPVLHRALAGLFARRKRKRVRARESVMSGTAEEQRARPKRHCLPRL